MMNQSSNKPVQTGNVEAGSLELLSQIGANPADILVAADKTKIQPAETKSSPANWKPLVLSLFAALAVVVFVTACVLTYLSLRDLRKQVAELKTQKPTEVVLTPTKTPNATPSSTNVPPTPTNTAFFTATPTSPAPISFTLAFDPPSIDLKIYSEPITVTVRATTSDGFPIANIAVTLELSGAGKLSTYQLTTDSDGKSSFIYYTPSQTLDRAEITATSGAATPAILIVYPPPATPVTLALDPTAFDVGVGEERTVTVTVRGVNDQQPARGVPITIVADPLQSVKVKQPSELTTDERGEVRATLEFQEVATGELRVSAAGDEPVTATIRVRPVAVNASKEAKNLRAEASEASDNVGDFAAGSRLPIVGQRSDGSWLQVRTGTGSLAWVKRDVVKVEGDVTQVDVVAATPTPTPTNTPTPAPKPTSTKAAATPKPADYPTVGAHQLVVDKSDNLAPMYRVGGTGEGDILLRMPAHSVTVLAQDTKDARPPAGFVLVAATVWVDKSKVSENAGDFSLNNPDENVSACWSVTADKCEGGGLLFKNSQWYSVGKIKPEENGNYAKVTVWVWVKRANIQ